MRLLIWHVQEGALTLDHYSGSLQAQNGTIYVTYNRNSIYHLYALRANDGKLLWTKQIPYLVDSYALRSTDGSIIWQYQSNTGNGILVG